MALNDEFESVRSSLLYKDTPLDLDIVVIELFVEEVCPATLKSRQFFLSIDNVLAIPTSSLS